MNPTTILSRTTFSKRLIAATAVISLATTGALIARNAPSPSAVMSEMKPVSIPQRVDVCSSVRPASVWFPPQVEMQFAAQCGAGTSPIHSNVTAKPGVCAMPSTQRGWLPPQVEMQFANLCA